MADTALTSLLASCTLPSGINGKLRMYTVSESKRWKDSEGFIDLGFQTGKLTGQGMAGRVVGYINDATPGFATQFENVSVSFQATTGRTMTINVDITDIEWGVSVGEIQSFAANFRSNGSYTAGTV